MPQEVKAYIAKELPIEIWNAIQDRNYYIYLRSTKDYKICDLFREHSLKQNGIKFQTTKNKDYPVKVWYHGRYLLILKDKVELSGWVFYSCQCVGCRKEAAKRHLKYRKETPLKTRRKMRRWMKGRPLYNE